MSNPSQRSHTLWKIDPGNRTLAPTRSYSSLARLKQRVIKHGFLAKATVYYQENAFEIRGLFCWEFEKEATNWDHLYAGICYISLPDPLTMDQLDKEISWINCITDGDGDVIRVSRRNPTDAYLIKPGDQTVETIRLSGAPNDWYDALCDSLSRGIEFQTTRLNNAHTLFHECQTRADSASKSFSIYDSEHDLLTVIKGDAILLGNTNTGRRTHPSINTEELCKLIHWAAEKSDTAMKNTP